MSSEGGLVIYHLTCLLYVSPSFTNIATGPWTSSGCRLCECVLRRQQGCYTVPYYHRWEFRRVRHRRDLARAIWFNDATACHSTWLPVYRWRTSDRARRGHWHRRFSESRRFGGHSSRHCQVSTPTSHRSSICAATRRLRAASSCCWLFTGLAVKRCPRRFTTTSRQCSSI